MYQSIKVVYSDFAIYTHKSQNERHNHFNLPAFHRKLIGHIVHPTGNIHFHLYMETILQSALINISPSFALSSKATTTASWRIRNIRSPSIFRAYRISSTTVTSSWTSTRPSGYAFASRSTNPATAASDTRYAYTTARRRLELVRLLCARCFCFCGKVFLIFIERFVIDVWGFFSCREGTTYGEHSAGKYRVRVYRRQVQCDA